MSNNERFVLDLLENMGEKEVWFIDNQEGKGKVEVFLLTFPKEEERPIKIDRVADRAEISEKDYDVFEVVISTIFDGELYQNNMLVLFNWKDGDTIETVDKYITKTAKEEFPKGDIMFEELGYNIEYYPNDYDCIVTIG